MGETAPRKVANMVSNIENGMGNNADMNSLLRKLNTLTDNEAANNCVDFFCIYFDCG